MRVIYMCPVAQDLPIQYLNSIAKIVKISEFRLNRGNTLNGCIKMDLLNKANNVGNALGILILLCMNA